MHSAPFPSGPHVSNSVTKEQSWSSADVHFLSGDASRCVQLPTQDWSSEHRKDELFPKRKNLSLVEERYESSHVEEFRNILLVMVSLVENPFCSNWENMESEGILL